MIDTTRIRLKYQVWLETGDPSDAVNLLRHMPMLLETVDTQQALIQRAAKILEEHAKNLEALKGHPA